MTDFCFSNVSSTKFGNFITESKKNSISISNYKIIKKTWDEESIEKRFFQWVVVNTNALKPHWYYFGLAMGCFQKPCQHSWRLNYTFLLVET